MFIGIVVCSYDYYLFLLFFIYCMGITSVSFTEYITWLCEGCHGKDSDSNRDANDNDFDSDENDN